MDTHTTKNGLDRYLTPDRAFLFLVLVGVVQLSTYVFMALVRPDTFSFGGDFVAFWSAGREVLLGNIAELYPSEGLPAAIQTHQPDAAEETSRLTWQYPPHSTLVFSPVGLLPFVPAYLIWCALGLSAFAAAMKQFEINNKTLLALMLSPLVFLALVTGQNGLFTAALLVFAVTQVHKHPVLAGLAAAGLTIKPQLGLLLPIAYLAGRAWLPFVTAALASLALWGSSVLLAGKTSWFAFFDSILAVGGSVESGLMPLFKMVTLFSALRLIGVPGEVAVAASLLLAGVAMCAVGWVWHKTNDTELRLAALSATALLIAPYGFYYEMTIALPALFIVARRGHQTGWLPFEQALVALLLLTSLILPGPEIRHGLSFGFGYMLTITLLTFRRLAFELGTEQTLPVPASGLRPRKASTL